jgi:hypothetical protein
MTKPGENPAEEHGVAEDDGSAEFRPGSEASLTGPQEVRPAHRR